MTQSPPSGQQVLLQQQLTTCYGIELRFSQFPQLSTTTASSHTLKSALCGISVVRSQCCRGSLGGKTWTAQTWEGS